MSSAATQTETPSRHFEKYDHIVRCSDGHLYTTVWVPMMSLKALRFGSRRVQRCPVGHHWTTVVRVESGELTYAELEKAMGIHDNQWP
ncbi:hypothetical protein G7Z17_g2479 [Cylindrodendrum hubeiense]|uniref:Uncharacterized protein n=1 Tax=Cylindrodendrum hubeiense TaxID=595255 RepID=A0A9P5HJM9_9HYPO|nr:hypothetical protein G7Z17_g2479 [Cylindrodendrum hubeiense]